MENRKKILIIEDDEDISMIEEAYLESAGFETKILSDGNHFLRSKSIRGTLSLPEVCIESFRLAKRQPDLPGQHPL